MFHVADVLQLRDGEHIELILRHHTVDLWPKLFLSGALLVLPFFFLFALVQLGVFGVLFFCLAVGAGFYFSARTLILWDARVLLLTNKRLIYVDQKGLWQRIVSEASLAEIRSIESRRTGFLDTLCRTATVRVLSTSAAPVIEFRRAPRAKTFTAKLSELQGAPRREPL